MDENKYSKQALEYKLMERIQIWKYAHETGIYV